MKLTDDLLSQFAKITKDDPKDKKETIVYGTVVVQNENKYVRLDGSEILTPVAATADTIDGERVIVMIKNHTATITGNITSPAARVGDIQAALDGIDKVGTVEEKVTVLQQIAISLDNSIKNVSNKVTRLQDVSGEQSISISTLSEYVSSIQKQIDILKKQIAGGSISSSGIMTDTVTGKDYILEVVEGKLTMRAIDTTSN